MEWSPTRLLRDSNKDLYVRFYPETHKYAVTYDILGGTFSGVPSVTYIIQAVFGNKLIHVNPEVLQRATEKGSIVHEEILNSIVKGERGITPEHVQATAEIAYRGAGIIYPEQILYAETEYGNFAGTTDLFLGDTMVDYKTSYAINTANVTRQLNMYAYAARFLGYHPERLEVWHLRGNLIKVKNIKMLPDIYTETIMRAFSEGQQFKNDSDMLSYYGVKEL